MLCGGGRASWFVIVGAAARGETLGGGTLDGGVVHKSDAIERPGARGGGVGAGVGVVVVVVGVVTAFGECGSNIYLSSTEL